LLERYESWVTLAQTLHAVLFTAHQEYAHSFCTRSYWENRKQVVGKTDRVK